MRYHQALALPFAAVLLSSVAGFASAAIPGQSTIATANQAVASRAGALGQVWQMADRERGERQSRDQNGEGGNGEDASRIDGSQD